MTCHVMSGAIGCRHIFSRDATGSFFVIGVWVRRRLVERLA